MHPTDKIIRILMPVAIFQWFKFTIASNLQFYAKVCSILCFFQCLPEIKLTTAKPQSVGDQVQRGWKYVARTAIFELSKFATPKLTGS
jgi:hypothetical protein